MIAPRTLSAVDQFYRTGRRVARASIAVSGVLACSNITIGLLAQSTSVVATGFEFAGDVPSSIVVIGMGVAARPPDDNHPYGHGRFETLSAFRRGRILAAGGVPISYHSLQAIGARHAPPGVTAAAALVSAIILRGIMSSVKFRVGRRLRSSALIADAWNDAVDILSALAALTAVALATYDLVRFLAADHYGGFVVGIVVVITGIRVLRDATLELVDTMPGPDLTSEILATAKSVAQVRGIDKVFVRKTGFSITSTCTSNWIRRSRLPHPTRLRGTSGRI